MLQCCNAEAVLMLNVCTQVKEIKRVLKSFMMKLQARDAKERLAMEWRLVARDAKERLAMEWRLVALALDRMFFVLYISTIVAFFVTSILIYQVHLLEFAHTMEDITGDSPDT